MRSPGRVWDGAPGRRALREEMPPKAAGASPRHTGFPRIFLVWVGEAQGTPAGNCLNCQEVTLISPLRGHLPPLEGEGWAGGPGVPPLRSDYEPSGTGGHMGPLLRRETNRERWLGNPGAVAEPQQRQFLQGQGPVARNETIKATQILRAGNTAKPDRYASPVVGVLGGRRI